MPNLEQLAGCVMLQDNKILLVREKNQDYYKIPGGKIEDRETPEQAAIREVKEETGFDVSLQIKLGEYDFVFKNRLFFLHVYIAQIESGNLSPRNTKEETINTVEWLPVDALNTPPNKIPSNQFIYFSLRSQGLVQ